MIRVGNVHRPAGDLKRGWRGAFFEKDRGRKDHIDIRVLIMYYGML